MRLPVSRRLHRVGFKQHERLTVNPRATREERLLRFPRSKRDHVRLTTVDALPAAQCVRVCVGQRDHQRRRADPLRLDQRKLRHIAGAALQGETVHPDLLLLDVGLPGSGEDGRMRRHRQRCRKPRYL